MRICTLLLPRLIYVLAASTAIPSRRSLARGLQSSGNTIKKPTGLYVASNDGTLYCLQVP